MAVNDTAPAVLEIARPTFRERVGASLVRRVAKVFGGTEPASFQIGEQAAGMTPALPFSPGEPTRPYDGYSRTPRSGEFATGINIAARPRSNERVAFSTLKGLIDAYDVAQACIYHRIDSIRSLEWSLVAKPGHQGDVQDAIALAMSVLETPDGETPWDAWLAEYLFDVLAYDAGTLWRMRNRAGQTVGLRVIDGTSIAPLRDYWGNTPKFPAEAYVQYQNGLPWNWLTTNDLIYQPFRKRPGEPYGRPPLEAILLNANTDLRFQAYFLERFTSGNIPAAFASAPESWTPQQIEMFQGQWDAFMQGDQSRKAQIRWIPGGSTFAWSNEKDFSDAFSLFMLRKTAMVYHVVPTDLGITDTVNKSSGETQTDVQHRIGDVPLAKHLSTIITRFLQDDLHVPLVHQFDFGEEQDDRLQTAQADDLYVKMGAVSTSDIRELRFGMSEPEGQRVPRFIFSNRGGPVPLSALDAVAGPIDPDSGAPEPGAPLPHKVFQPVEGVEAQPPTPRPPLAVDLYGPGALPDQAPQDVPDRQAEAQPAPVAKDGPSAGITAATGLTSYDLIGRTREGDEDDEALEKELATYRRYLKGRRRAGRWKDFGFDLVDRATAHRLNDAGRLAVRKGAGQLAVAGLAVVAADTGRVLMLQRGLDPEDPAAGFWEMPGGHIEDGETPLAAAEREWQEETGLLLPADALTEADPDAVWTSPDGIYRGFAVTVACEASLPIGERGRVVNPDDPDGDLVESLAWWSPNLLPENPAIRPELRAETGPVLAAIDTALAPCPA